MELKKLIGKSILDVISELPNFEWTFVDSGKLVKPKIRELTFALYQWNKPRTQDDLYWQNTYNINDKILMKKIEDLAKTKEKGVGLISRVRLGEPYTKSEHKRAHIPSIDFDLNEKLDSLTEKELIDIIKKNIKEVTEIEQGLILKSSSKRNYHFIGTNRLFSDEDFITFLGFCLTMGYSSNGKTTNLTDSRYIGHSLTSLKYIGELNRWSKYENSTRFSTLRVNSKDPSENIPVVVDVLN